MTLGLGNLPQIKNIDTGKISQNITPFHFLTSLTNKPFATNEQITEITVSYTSAEQKTKHVDPSCTSYDYYSILRTVSEHTEKQGVRKMIEAMITPTSQHKEGDRSHSFSLTHSLQEQGYIIHKEILGQL